MDNTDIFLERCQVAFICCEVHLVSGLTKDLAVPFFSKWIFRQLQLHQEKVSHCWSSGPESRLYVTWQILSPGGLGKMSKCPLKAREPRDLPASALASPLSGWPVPQGWGMFHRINEFETGQEETVISPLYRQLQGSHIWPQLANF